MGGVSLQIINLQTGIILIRSRFIQLLVICDCDPPNDPHMGGGVSTNHKSSNRIELSRLGQDLLNC